MQTLKWLVKEPKLNLFYVSTSDENAANVYDGWGGEAAGATIALMDDAEISAFVLDRINKKNQEQWRI